MIIIPLFILPFISNISLAYDYFSLPGIKDYKGPPKGFPWDFRPDTAEKIDWLTYGVEHLMTRNNTGFFVLLDGRGHFRQQLFTFEAKYYYDDYGKPNDPYDDFGDAMDWKGGKVKPGDVKLKTIIQWYTPPEMRARAFLIWDYLDSTSVRKDAERWLYLSAARRIRRLSGGDREDSIGGTDGTYDDVTGREVFEWKQTLLGEDTIYPEEYPMDEKFWKLRLEKPKKCWVIESIPKIPDYYLSKRILWVNQERGDLLREEQYGKDGNLLKIFNFYYKLYPIQKAPPKTWPFVTYLHMWNLKIDHRTLTWFNLNWFGVPNNTVPEEHFAPEFMRREVFLFPETGLEKIFPVEKIKSADDLPGPPILMLDKFKEHRKISEEVLERLRKKYGESLK